MDTMDEIHERQRLQEEMQRSEGFVDVFSKIVSGREGYKTIVPVKPITTKCKNCSAVLQQKQKFCHECGAKNSEN